MIRYKTNLPVVQISINSDNPNRSGLIEYAGDSRDIELVRSRLQNCYGVAGHRIGDECSPIDLQAAMKKPAMQVFKPELLEGDSKKYDLGLPENVQS